MTGSGIHHFEAQSKIASISEEFPGDCFDFDRLSAFSLGGSVLKLEQREAVSLSREDFPSCRSISAPRCFFKRISRRILSTPAHSEILRPSLREDQAGVIHAISPIWMKLCQIEGTTKQL